MPVVHYVQDKAIKSWFCEGWLSPQIWRDRQKDRSLRRVFPAHGILLHPYCLSCYQDIQTKSTRSWFTKIIFPHFPHQISFGPYQQHLDESKKFVKLLFSCGYLSMVGTSNGPKLFSISVLRQILDG